MDRRPLSAGVNAIPNTDPELAREFITQERRPTSSKLDVVNPPSAEASTPRLSGAIADRSPRLPTTEPTKRRRAKSAGVMPVGLIPVTVRLRPDIAGALKRASLERQLTGDELFTQQDLVQAVLEPWLRSEGFLA